MTLTLKYIYASSPDCCHDSFKTKILKIGQCWVIAENVKIEFSKCVIFWQKTEISPKNKCSIFIKTGYAQLHMMVNNCVKFQVGWLLFEICCSQTEFSKFVIFSKKNPEILPKNKYLIFIKIGYAQLHMMLNSVKFHTYWLYNFWNLPH